ncbi:hypothetical protein AVEN_28132-1 [Araneus ventricosus]|uniref:Uncharacterized protein n=1 Tax=Araneus ventricosus TaxID=182803 RepID=A0A4Y2MN60_ARAVE|nr:hypothetical protein AVEN_28132-1 [Araneus ventricosus]
MKAMIAPEQKKARKLVKSQTPTPGNSYVSAVKKSTAPSTQTNQDISADSTSKQSVPIPRTPPAITNLSNPSIPSVAPLSENTSASPDLTDFKLVSKRKKLKKDSPSKTNSISTAEKISKFYTTSSPKVTNPIPTKDNISSHKSTFKPLETTKRTTVDIELLPMAVLPPLEKRILQTRESDADAEMSSSSLSEEDALEYDMSEDLEDSPAVNSPPPSSKPQKGDKYKNSTSALSENSSISEKSKIKRPRDNKKLTKKSNQLAQAKESKEDKRARILAAKRDQTSLGDGSLSREDFFKDSFKTNKIGDDDDSDSLLKVHPSEDDMSTSEVDEPPLSS